MFYLGIDVSKKSHRFAVLDNEGERCAPAFSEPSNHEGFGRIISRLGNFGLSPDNTLAARVSAEERRLARKSVSGSFLTGSRVLGA